MKGKDGFLQGYNAQAAVDAKAQVIVAHGLTDNAADAGQLIPMADAVAANTGAKPAQLSADSGYCSEENLAALEARRITGFVATGRQKHGQAAADGGEARKKGPKVEAMRERLREGGFEAPIACASRPSSRCSARSSTPEASDSSSCEAWPRSPANGRCSAPPTTCSSSPPPGPPEAGKRTACPLQAQPRLLAQAPRAYNSRDKELSVAGPLRAEVRPFRGAAQAL